MPLDSRVLLPLHVPFRTANYVQVTKPLIRFLPETSPNSAHPFLGYLFIWWSLHYACYSTNHTWSCFDGHCLPSDGKLCKGRIGSVFLAFLCISAPCTVCGMWQHSTIKWLNNNNKKCNDSSLRGSLPNFSRDITSFIQHSTKQICSPSFKQKEASTFFPLSPDCWYKLGHSYDWSGSGSDVRFEAWLLDWIELQNVYMQYFLSLQHAYQFEMLPQLLVVNIGELEGISYV